MLTLVANTCVPWQWILATFQQSINKQAKCIVCNTAQWHLLQAAFVHVRCCDENAGAVHLIYGVTALQQHSAGRKDSNLVQFTERWPRESTDNGNGIDWPAITSLYQTDPEWSEIQIQSM